MWAAPVGYDVEVWSQLPEEIRKELQQEDGSGRSRGCGDVSGDEKVSLGKRGASQHSEEDDSAGVTAVNGSDNVLPLEEMKKWSRLIEEFRDTATVFSDEDFPASSFSICGREDKEDSKTTGNVSRPRYEVGMTPECYCHALAMKRVVRLNTPNKGREYFCCQIRKCKYFQWADGDDHVPSQSSKRRACSWTRFGDSLPLVSDYGFRAEDLLQGGVGDCWFMSALAVVAARHDLISRLFEMPSSALSSSAGRGVDTTTIQTSNAAGVYAVRLFLDGEWTTIVVDDQLPISGSPRRLDIALNFSNLAFCRCGSVETGGQQLWASLIEKAYAKAHGSYQAISGGEISEALLDLTGAPSVSVDFAAVNFKSDELWENLCRWRAEDLPMGCSTDADPNNQLQEMGLFGNHAYSIVDVRQVHKQNGTSNDWYRTVESINCMGHWNEGFCDTRHHGAEVIRLIKIRNPHGVGEWRGAYSDNSIELKELADWGYVTDSHGRTTNVAPTGKEDGTFWMDFTHFLLGFSRVDVSLAYRDWHSKSFRNYFPSKDNKWRICSTCYWLQHRPLPIEKRCDKNIFVTMTALQPTRRGAWCRADVKKSYKYGQLCLILLKRQSNAKNNTWSVVAGSLSGAARETTIGAILEKSNEGSDHYQYLLMVFCLGSPPSAAETLSRQPFFVRFTSNQSIAVEEISSTKFCGMTSSTLDDDMADLNHLASPSLAHYCLHLSLTQFFGKISKRPHVHTQQAVSFDQDMIALNEKVSRKIQRLSEYIVILILQSPSSLIVYALNSHPRYDADDESSFYVEVTVVVHARSACVRDMNGLIRDNKEKSNAYNNHISDTSIQNERNLRNTFRYPAKWSTYESSTGISAGEGRVLMIVTSSGIQYATQDMQFTYKERVHIGNEKNKSAQFMYQWATQNEGPTGSTRRYQNKKFRPSATYGLFEPFRLSSGLLNNLTLEVLSTSLYSSAHYPIINDNTELDEETQAALDLSLDLDHSKGDVMHDKSIYWNEHQQAEDEAYHSAVQESIMTSRQEDVVCVDTPPTASTGTHTKNIIDITYSQSPPEIDKLLQSSSVNKLNVIDLIDDDD